MFIFFLEKEKKGKEKDKGKGKKPKKPVVQAAPLYVEKEVSCLIYAAL